MIEAYYHYTVIPTVTHMDLKGEHPFTCVILTDESQDAGGKVFLPYGARLVITGRDTDCGSNEYDPAVSAICGITLRDEDGDPVGLSSQDARVIVAAIRAGKVPGLAGKDTP